jgi:tRNA-2-methylthio-N6-dimethylallyladenosine synthase
MINQKGLYIETFGCAMNQKDSEHIIAELTEKENYIETRDPKDADLIIINTCSVREKPVNKLFSELGQFNKIRKSDSKVGVVGCTASHLGKEIIRKAPFVDFVLGARNVSKIGTVIHQKGAVEVDIDHDDSLYRFQDYKVSDYKTALNISIGCDKSCTFCIVPHTRGSEISIPTDLILDEVKRGVDSGAVEFLLLGQNVNNYGRRFSANHQKTDFNKLLQRVSEISGVQRIRFTSPHPLHMNDEFIDLIAENSKIARSMHMPLQSGSSEILRQMKRGYSKEWFLNRVEKLRNAVPDIAISSDIIVGFPGESEDDFRDTMEVLNYSKFEQLFSFVYSPRPHTEAQNFGNSVPLDIAKRRLAELQGRQSQILDEVAEKRVGKTFSVLFDRECGGGVYSGRSSQNHTVRVEGDSSLLGTFRDVKIESSKRTDSRGVLI